MPLFFLLSGILFTPSDNLKTLLEKNFTSLIIPYILFNIIVFIILIPYYIYIGEDLKKLLLYFLIADGKSPAGACWFLICIFNLKIISYFILKLRLKFQIPIITILVVLCFNFITSKGIDLYFTVDSSIMALPFFIGGYYFKKYALDTKVTNKYILLFTFFLSLFILTISSKLNGTIGMHGCFFGKSLFLFYINAFIGCCMSISLFKLFNNIKSHLMYVFSSGTIVILAFHLQMPMFIYKALFLLFGFTNVSFTSNILISALIMILLYYPILFIQKHCPILVGNRK